MDDRHSSDRDGALRSPLAFQRRGRPLRHWSAAQRAGLLAQLAAVHVAWCEDWGLASDGADGSGVRIAEVAATALGDASTRLALGAALLGAGDVPAHPRDVGSDAPCPWADALVAEAVADWHERMAACVGPAAGARVPVVWSGALHLQFAVRGCTWGLRLDASQVHRALGPVAAPAAGHAMGPPLTPAWQALSSRPVDLRVDLAPVTLRLGQLRALQVGDVLQLPHRLDQPLRVGVSPGGGVGDEPSPLCDAWLGRCGSRLAIQCAGDVT